MGRHGGVYAGILIQKGRLHQTTARAALSARSYSRRKAANQALPAASGVMAKRRIFFSGNAGFLRAGIRCYSLPALLLHGGIADQHRPDIGAGLGDAISPRRSTLKPAAPFSLRAGRTAGHFQKRKNQNLLYSTRQRNAAKRSGGSRSSLFSQTHTMRKAPKVRKL